MCEIRVEVFNPYPDRNNHLYANNIMPHGIQYGDDLISFCFADAVFLQRGEGIDVCLIEIIFSDVKTLV